MLEWTQIDQGNAIALAGFAGALIAAFLAGWRGVIKGKKNAPETPLPTAPQSLDLARMESFLVREFASLRHDMERIEGRQSTANGRVLDLLTRIDDRTK